MQHFHKHLGGFANILLQISLKMGNKVSGFNFNFLFSFFLIFFFQKYFFALLKFFQIVIFTTLLRCWSALWNSRLKITTVLRSCSTFKSQRWHTQRCFNVDLTLSDVMTSYQPGNNVKTTLKYLLILLLHIFAAQKISIKDFFSKCDQIHSYLPIWSHFWKKSLMGNFIFCTVVLTGKINK